MKITKAQLKQLIKEELEQTLEEAPVVIPEEQLDEYGQIVPMVAKALSNPAVRQALASIVMPMIQKAMAAGTADPAEAPAAPAPEAPAE